MRFGTIALAIGIFALTFGCLELWCETVVHFRWTYSAKMITQSQIAVTQKSLRNYARDCGSFPSKEQGLRALFADPGIAKWRGPYLSENDIRDYWGYELRFCVQGDRIQVWSVGADGNDGTDDDIR
jgi:hypothetical protein